MSGNRVVVHKRNQNPSPIDQLGTTIPMAELFAPVESPTAAPRPKPERPVRLVPVPMDQAGLVGDMPQASMAARTVQAVVFDLEGTLLDTAGWRKRSLDRALEQFGFRLPTTSVGDDNHDPRWLRNNLDNMSQDHDFPRGLHGAVERLESVIAARDRIEALQPGFEKEYLLVRLRREGYRLVACTRTDPASARAALEASGLIAWFELVVSATDAIQPKPSPEVFLSVCDQLGVRPKQVLAIESDPKGIEAARHAGVHLCRVTDRKQTEWSRIAPILEQLESRTTGTLAC